LLLPAGVTVVRVGRRLRAFRDLRRSYNTRFRVGCGDLLRSLMGFAAI
jgi:hypothetical protein